MRAAKIFQSLDSDSLGSKQPGELTAYLGHIVSPTGPESYSDFRCGAMLVDAAGTIAGIGPWSQLRQKYRSVRRIVDFGKRLLIPGLVDMHLHLPQITQIGRSGQSLLGWLEEYIFPAEARFLDSAHALRVATWFFDELVRNGTTTACVFTTIHAEASEIAFRVAASRGNRVIMGKVMMDANAPESLSEDSSLALHQSEELCRRWHGHDGGRLLYAFTPRFALTSSSNLLSGTGSLWSKFPGTYLHTHLAENQEEVLLVKRQFPGSRSYTDVYQSHGLLARNSIFAHSIHLDQHDLTCLAETKSALAHCPSSNFFLKSGAFPYEQVKQVGVSCGLGSDVAAGPGLCLFGVMKDAAYMQADLWISPAELLYLGTLAGARALNLDQKVGSLLPGKEADFLVINPGRKSCIQADILDRTTDEILSSLVYLGDDRLVEATYVRGRAVYQVDEGHVESQRQRKAGAADMPPAVYPTAAGLK